VLPRVLPRHHHGLAVAGHARTLRIRRTGGWVGGSGTKDLVLML
jgi:hypothetical protein